MKQRNQSIDILKGIGITLVLVAHSLGGTISHFAYTFHMPLFFIVTGLFIASPPALPRINIKKDFNRLVGPTLFSTALITVVSCLWYAIPDSYLQNPVNLLWGGESHGWWDMNLLGNLWFLFALFFAKVFFGCLTKVSARLSVILLLSFAVGGTALIVSHYVYMPYMILRGVSVLPFIAIGYSVRCLYYKDGDIHFSQLAKGIGVVTVMMWLAYLTWCNEVVLNFSWGYVPDILAACGGTLACYYLSKLIYRYTHVTKVVFTSLGINSLLLICGPTIETYCFPMQVVMPEMPMRSLFVIAGKVLWCVLFVVMCRKIEVLRRVYM